MSEYITVEMRPTADPDVVEIITNQPLAPAGDEFYPDFEAGDQGSPLAQTLFNGAAGIAALAIRGSTLVITRHPDAPWEAIVDDVRDALRDFFL